MKAALLGCEQAFHTLGVRRCRWLSRGTIEPIGTMLAGQSVEALATSLEHADLLYLGLNCATGPEFMTDHIRSLAAMSSLPGGLRPERRAAGRERPLPRDAGDAGAACCAASARRAGSTSSAAAVARTPDHIRAISPRPCAGCPRAGQPPGRSRLSGVDYLEVGDDVRPVIVGERTNVIGSRKFKELIVAEDWEDASEVARAQVKRGAQVIDVCLANPDREERADLRRFLEVVVKKVRVPLMIDTTDDARASPRRSPTARARPSSTPSTSRTARSASRRWCRSPANSARRWWWAASTRCGHGRDARAQAGRRRAQLSSCSPRSTGSSRRTSTSTRWSSRAPPATPSTRAAAWRPSRACG